MKLLIHTCCADCALKMIEKINPGIEICLYFYNPNIHPESEWQARKNAVKQVFADKPYGLVFTNWTPKDYFAQVKGPLDRCPKCWRVRLIKTFEYAKANGFDQVSSTLFTSIYHDQTVLRQIAADLGKQFGIEVYYPKTVDYELKTAGFFKQNYCGCLFSLMEKYQGKYC